MKGLLDAMRSLKTENTLLKETGEWDDTDDEMNSWKENMRDQATYLADNIEGGRVKSVHGFDKYQGPFAVVETPKHGDVTVWFDQEDDSGLSFNVKVAHVGWISGGLDYLAKLLNQDEIPENEVINESLKTEGNDSTEKAIKQIQEIVENGIGSLSAEDTFNFLSKIESMCKTYKEELTKNPGNKPDAEEFVKDVEIMKKTGIWDGRDETFQLARKKLNDIRNLTKGW